MQSKVLADLESLHRKLNNGTFFSDYDEDVRLMGVLHKYIEDERKDYEKRRKTEQRNLLNKLRRRGSAAPA